MKLSNFVPALRAVNWAKWVMPIAVGLVVCIAVGMASYFKGNANGQIKCAEEQAKAMETLAIDLRGQITDQQKEMSERFSAAESATVEFVKMQQELSHIQEGIVDALKQRASNPACVPTPAERRMYQAIADKTRDTR